MEFKLERWEDDEFIITQNGEPIGCTLTEGSGRVILEWLNNNAKEIWKECSFADNELNISKGEKHG